MSNIICTKCKEEKTPEEFYNDKRNLTGKSSICINCQKGYKKKHSIPWNKTYKCKECGGVYTIENFNLYASGKNRSKNCIDCIEGNKLEKQHNLWCENNKETVEEHVKHLRKVTGINGEDDLLKKYKP